MTGRRLVVIAGAGVLPREVAAAARASDDAVLVLALVEQDFPAGVDVRSVSVADLTALLGVVRAFGATHLALAGAVELNEGRRQAIAAALGGAGGETADVAVASLGSSLRRLTGAELIGVHELVPELLAPLGHIAGPAIRPEDAAAAGRVLEAARAVGRLDLGQAAVATAGRVLASEDVAGTDDLLRRVARFRGMGLVGESRLFLGKAAKPQQPDFVDLPAIGPLTVINAAAADVAVIVLEAGRTLLLDRGTLIARANELGVTVVGLDG